MVGWGQRGVGSAGRTVLLPCRGLGKRRDHRSRASVGFSSQKARFTGLKVRAMPGALIYRSFRLLCIPVLLRDDGERVLDRADFLIITRGSTRFW